MICSKFGNLIAFSLVLFALPGCQAQTESSPQEASQSGQSNSQRDLQPDPETAKIIRQLAAQAAGISDPVFRKLASGATIPSPLRLENQPLSLIIMCVKVMDLPDEVVKERSAEFRFSSSTPNPNKLVKLLEPTTTVDCWTALHPKYIKNVTCNVKDDTATGEISFDAELYSGHVQYVASKVKENWQINEFSFPVRDWRFVRGEDGNWQWHDHFGHIKEERELPVQNIGGRVLIDDKQIQRGQIVFTMRAYPEFYFSSKVGPNGDFGFSIPAGKYIVTCSSRELSDRFGKRSKSGLVVDIEKGQSELVLKLKSAASDQVEIDLRNDAIAKNLVAAVQKSLESKTGHYGLFRDLKSLAEMDIPESSRAAVTEISKSILGSKFGLDTKSAHKPANEILKKFKQGR